MIVSAPDVPLLLLVYDMNWRNNNHTTPAVSCTYTLGNKNAFETGSDKTVLFNCVQKKNQALANLNPDNKMQQSKQASNNQKKSNRFSSTTTKSPI